MALNAKTEEIIENLIFKRPSKITINKKRILEKETKVSNNSQLQEREEESECEEKNPLPFVLDKAAEELTNAEVSDLIEKYGSKILFELFPDDPDPNAPVVFEEYIPPQKEKTEPPTKFHGNEVKTVVEDCVQEVKHKENKNDELNRILNEELNKINKNLISMQNNLNNFNKYAMKRNMNLLKATYFNFEK